MSRRTVVVGAGRAGGSFQRALTAVGWEVGLLHHGDLGTAKATEVLDGALARDDAGELLVLLCVPDSAVAAMASRLAPDPRVVVAHCSGSLGLDALAPHQRVASLHPLVSMPDAPTGERRLRGAWFAVSGDRLARRVAEALGGSVVEVPEERRGAYHAAAAIASNHLVALLEQVRRIAGTAGVPLEAYLDLVRATVDNVEQLGPGTALTGPVSRGDWDTVRAHLSGMEPGEVDEYLAGVAAVADLAGGEVPDDLRARRDR